MTDIFGIYWAGIDRLIWLLPLGLGITLLIITQHIHLMRGVRQLAHQSHQHQLLLGFSTWRQRTKASLIVLTTWLIIIAFLQPQYGEKEQQVMQETRDLIILLDISRSMLAQDFSPSRLELAKLKIKELLTLIPFERIGLVLFSGSAFIQCPLTVDHHAFKTLLNHVSTEIISSGTTAMDLALGKALELYEKMIGKKNKHVLLITDGEDFSLNLESIKQQAQEQHIHLFTLGMATPQGAPIPIIDTTGKQIGHEKDEQGTIVLSKLNTELLTNISHELNGVFVPAGYDDHDVQQLAQAINQGEKEEFMDTTVSRYEEQYPWLLGGAWLCLLLEWLL